MILGWIICAAYEPFLLLQVNFYKETFNIVEFPPLNIGGYHPSSLIYCGGVPQYLKLGKWESYISILVLETSKMVTYIYYVYY